MKAVGRGANFSRKRGFMEAVARVVYRGGWAGRVLGMLPGHSVVDLLQHRLAVLPARADHPDRILRIAFASDFHLGPLTSPALLDNAFALLTEARPDVLILGGDYVFLDATPEIAGELEARVAAVPAPVKLAVLGNHDLWTRHDRLERALANAGARVLVNTHAWLPPPFDDIAVLGLDDPFTGKPDATQALRDTAHARMRVGVVHSPEGLPLLRGQGVSLMLCGHTHGGQIALPSGPIVVHGKNGRRYPSGLFQIDDDLRLFVSRGLGCVELPFRVHAAPDVSLFTLVPALPLALAEATARLPGT